MVLAIVLGIIALLAVQRYIVLKTQSRTVRTPPVTGPVLIANAEIIPGTALTAKLVKEATWPKELIPPKALQSVSQIEGRVVRVPLSQGEPILTNKLAPEGTAAGLAGLLPNEKLAVTVRTDDVSGVAGFIHAGDRVDVLVTLPVPGSQSGEQFSKIILQNILVLSAGQVWEQTTEEGKGCKPGNPQKPRVYSTATLEVTPPQAEILNLGAAQGKIRLALRNSINHLELATSGVFTSGLIQKKARESKLEVIKGMTRSHVNL